MDDLHLVETAPSDLVDLPVHPAAEAFPMLLPDELAALAEDIAEKGLFDAIMLDSEGKQLVDGRNRLAACRIAAVEPRFERLAPDIDVRGYIVSKNITRRDLTKGQKALALALIYPETEKGGRGRKSVAKTSAISGGFSMDMVDRARQIIRHADLTDMVRSGAIAFNDALQTAQDRARLENNAAYYLARLDEEAPDLAAQVREERLSMRQAYAAFVEREKEAAEAEYNERAGLSRITESTYRGLKAFTNADFVARLEQRLGDPKFADELARLMDVKADTEDTPKELRAALNTVLKIARKVASKR